MQKLILSASLAALCAFPAMAQDTQHVEIKVPVSPASADDVVAAHQKVLDAAKEACAVLDYKYEYLRSRAVAERKCVKAAYSETIERARADQLAVFLDDAALVGTQFE
ncbi:MAG: hypothetical protein CMK09_09965 [Ponticaulis sp.]|nr:hypothetical protein [Ponticaulis sp.]|tara:strand:- start:13726 stop:14049 length:324 start_codon:yes stop_codon:yes gene_type:complete